MLVLHHLEHSRSQRILWLLEELGLDYTLQRYERDARTNLAPESLKQVHPLGRSPLLGTEQGVLAESAAMAEYLIELDGSKQFAPPTGLPALQEYRYWLHFAEGSLMPPMVANMILEKARQKGGPFFIRPVVNKLVDGILAAYYGPNLAESLQHVEAHLGLHDWFVENRPTAADVQMIFPLEALVASGRADRYTAIKAYVQRVHQRPAYQRALQKGGSYAYA